MAEVAEAAATEEAPAPVKLSAKAKMAARAAKKAGGAAAAAAALVAAEGAGFDGGESRGVGAEVRRRRRGARGFGARRK